MKIKKNRQRKKVVNTAALGLSLLMSSTLLVGNAVAVYASPTISTDEQNVIDAFLATQPTDGATRNIGTTNPTVTPSTYTFPGINNYVSVFRDPSGDMRLTQDRVYTCTVVRNGYTTTTNVKIKDWSTIDWYMVKKTPAYERSYTDRGLPIRELYFTNKITVINQTDNSEMTLFYPVFYKDDSGYYSLASYGLAHAAGANIPIEANDPRFLVEVKPEDSGEIVEYLYGEPAYWSMTTPVDNKYSYDTIIEIDESLKTNETVVSGGVFGEKSATFEHTAYVVTDTNIDAVYRQYTSDVIYNMMKTDLDNTTVDGYSIVTSYGWGYYFGKVHVTPSVDRLIRVGIDYTHYVADDGTVLKPTTYGLNPVDTIAGYQFVSSHREANGDLVHVYTVPTAPGTPSVPTTPSTPSSPSTPTTPSTPSTPATPSASPRTMDKASIFGFSVMFLVGIFTSVGVFFTRNKRA